MKLNLDRIVTSPLPRARRTAQIVAQELGLIDKLETSSALSAGTDAESLRDWLRERSEERLMIVGHNPAFSDLVGLLILGEVGKFPFELKKGGLAALSPTLFHCLISSSTGRPHQQFFGDSKPRNSPQSGKSTVRQPTEPPGRREDCLDTSKPGCRRSVRTTQSQS